jgi:hypothetical protein
MTNPTPTPHSADPVVSLLYRLAAKEAKDCQFETAVKIRACADFIAQRDASYPVAADQAEGLSLADVDELCAEFGFRLPDNEGRVCSKEVLRDMITAAITRWPLAAEPVTDPLQSEALLEIKPADAPVPQEAVLLDKGSGLMAFGMGRLGAFPAPQQSAAPPAVDISDKSVAGIRAVLLGLARSASPDAQPAAQPVNLAELHDPDFSGGLTPSQHLDVVHGGADPTWRPIETAPRDGTWVLLAGGECESNEESDNRGRVVTAQWTTEYRSNAGDRPIADFGRWEFAYYDSGVYGEYENPTHWQPLPSSPITPIPHA